MKVSKNIAGVRLYDGQPAVTDVLKEAESRFFKELRDKGGAKMAKTSETARELGTKVHSLVEKIVDTHATDETVEVDPLMLDFALAIRDFLNEWVDEILLSEQALIGHVVIADPTSGEQHAYGFGGRTDLIARVTEKHGGGIAVFDFKTSKKLSREHGLQLAAYATAARQSGFDVTRRFAVQIKKHGNNTGTGKYYVREYPDHALDYSAWAGILGWFYWHKKTMFEQLARQA